MWLFLMAIVCFLIWKIRDKDLEQTYHETCTRYETRIRELEERLCPCQSHDWHRTDYEFTGGTGCGDETILHHYQCAKCGKKTVTYKKISTGRN